MLTAAHVSLGEVAASSNARLDHRFHLYGGIVDETINALQGMRPLGSLVSRLTNGANVTAASYQEDWPGALASYLSVSSVSNGVLVLDETTPLGNTPQIKKLIASGAALKPGDIVITRSGTPGIAWPVSAESSVPLIPAGFMIRATCDTESDAVYLAAILSHPIWRLHTRRLSGGKRQDNIDQSSTKSIPIPWPDEAARLLIVQSHKETMRTIEENFAESSSFDHECDEILSNWLGFPPAVDENVWSRAVSASDIFQSPGLRLDGRWNSTTNFQIRAAIDRPVGLGSLLSKLPQRGRQPVPILGADSDDDRPLCVSTASLQQGQVIWQDIQRTDQSAARLRLLGTSDLLIAMDGVGSLGKCAELLQAPKDSVVCADSHVAAFKLLDTELNAAITCFLNSSWGRRQTIGLMTGATGQTQLSAADFARILVPQSLVENGAEIGALYREAQRAWEPPKIFARGALSSSAARVSAILAQHGCLPSGLEHDAKSLRNILEMLY